MISFRALLPAALLAWVGATLMLSELRWFSRPSLHSRLHPYLPAAAGAAPARGLLTAESFRDVIAPLASSLGKMLSKLHGGPDDLESRLRRIHSPQDATTFRIHQLGHAGAAMAAGIIAAQALTLPPAAAVLVVAGAPLLALLLKEQSLANASARRQRRIFLELPVLAEQLGMLLSAGFSLGSSLSRLASRGQGACSQDLQTVNARIQQGLTEVEALREWADLADVPCLHRLVRVLALNREAADLGRLIAEEARSARRDVQRETVEVIERRGQQVWIPVTVATLVPGVLFLAVPFIEAMRLFTDG